MGGHQDGEAEVKGCTPAGRGLEICSPRQRLRGQDGTENFHLRPSTIPSSQRMKQSKKDKVNTRPPSLSPNIWHRTWGGLGKGG